MRELVKRDVGYVDEGFGTPVAHDADPGGDLVCFAGEGVEHTARVGFVCRFAEQLSVEGDDGVGCHDRLAFLGMLFCHRRGLGAGQALDQVERALVRQSGLIDVCGYDAGVETRLTHQLDAARRLGGEDHSWIPSFTFSTATSPAMSFRMARAKGSAWPMPEAVITLPSTTTVRSPAKEPAGKAASKPGKHVAL